MLGSSSFSKGPKAAQLLNNASGCQEVGKHRAERVNPQIPLGCQRSFSVNVINQFHYLESFREDRELPECVKEGKEKLRSPFSPTAQWGMGGTTTPAW